MSFLIRSDCSRLEEFFLTVLAGVIRLLLRVCFAPCGGSLRVSLSVPARMTPNRMAVWVSCSERVYVSPLTTAASGAKTRAWLLAGSRTPGD